MTSAAKDRRSACCKASAPDMGRDFTLLALGGDHIGPEVVAAALQVLRRAPGGHGEVEIGRRELVLDLDVHGVAKRLG